MPPSSPRPALEPAALDSLAFGSPLSAVQVAIELDCKVNVSTCSTLSSRSLLSTPRKAVRFDLAANTRETVLEYATVYDRHPRDFVFDRRFEMVHPDTPPDRFD